MKIAYENIFNVSVMLMRTGAQVSVRCTDEWQGKDIENGIILCVRENKFRSERRAGFPGDKGRFTLTRTKHSRFMIGHAPTLSTKPVWNSSIEHCRAQNCYRDVGRPLWIDGKRSNNVKDHSVNYDR